VKRFINGIKYDGKVPMIYILRLLMMNIYIKKKKKITMFYTLVENDI
jgi:hypothetical protein